jgi:protease-4
MLSPRVSVVPAVATMCLALGLTACSQVQIEKPAPKNQLRELVLSEPSPEHSGQGLLSEPHYTQRETLEHITEAIEDKNVRGLFLRMGGFGGAWARAAEVRAALAPARKAKKPVHCYFEGSDNVGYALMASACDRISMQPTGMLELVGAHAQLVYARELLDQVGVRADLLQVGRFKGAADPLTQSEMPEETRQSMNALLDDFQAELTQLITQGRSLSEQDLSAAIDGGPHTAQAALRLRLVDAVSFDDEARAKAKQAAKAENVHVIGTKPEREGQGLGDLIKALLSDEEESGPTGKRLALVYLTGTIDNGEEDQGGGASAGPFVKELRKLADDDDVKAVVLRIDSPGGSALASDRMWHAVRRVQKRKPVIVSVGDMAASGGYYVACAGSEIFAEDTSLVGSIGVVGGKFVFGDLAQRLGVRVSALSRGKNAGFMSPVEPWTESERVAMMAALDETYRIFLSRITESRGLSGQKLEAMAEGRIHTGRRALAGGLVGTRGGLADALSRARHKGGLGADAELEVWPPERNFVERIATAFSAGDAHALPLQGISQVLARFGRSGLESALVRGDRGPLAALPFALDIR